MLPGVNAAYRLRQSDGCVLGVEWKRVGVMDGEAVRVVMMEQATFQNCSSESFSLKFIRSTCLHSFHQLAMVFIARQRRNELTYSLHTRWHDRTLSQRVTRLTDNNYRASAYCC